MGLWVHKGGELKRTVPGKHEDKRVTESPDWRPVTAEQVRQIQQSPEPAKLIAGLFGPVKQPQG